MVGQQLPAPLEPHPLPEDARAAQLDSLVTGANTRVLANRQTITTRIGSTAHQPIQHRLQMASAAAGMAARRVKTLSGLACRRQDASSIRNSFAMASGRAIFVSCGILAIPEGSIQFTEPGELRAILTAMRPPATTLA
jgi:hypothetical protein